MTRQEINILKLLGYTPSQEDGAILNCPYADTDGYAEYVWKDSSFKDVLRHHNGHIENNVRKQIVREILKQQQ